MNGTLLPYYEEELRFLRYMVPEFGAKHPDQASALQLDLALGKSKDPHVERILQSFALTAARIRRKIDDEFPEITEALLGLLYPHYLCPIPPLAIAQMEIDPEQGSLASGYPIKSGSELRSTQMAGAECKFRTCYPLQLWPIEVACASFVRTAAMESLGADADSAFAIRIELRTKASTRFSALKIENLRFYLGGDIDAAQIVYELLFNNCNGVRIRAIDDRNAQPEYLPSRSLRPVGFARDEGLLPYSDKSFIGYRLIQEYFAFPQKFLFFDICNFQQAARASTGQRIEVVVFLKKFDRPERIPLLQQAVDAGMFQLGCTPIVNLFECAAEPIPLSHAQTEYPIRPELHLGTRGQVYSVNRVTSKAPSSEKTREYLPFYSVRHTQAGNGKEAYWVLSRRAFAGGEDGFQQAYLSLVDLNFEFATPPVEALTVQITCMNPDVQDRIDTRREWGELELESGGLLQARFLDAPTAPVLPPVRRLLHWRLISQLSLNPLSIVSGGEDALRELLNLYDFSEDSVHKRQIGGIKKISSRPIVTPVTSEHGLNFASGIHVDMELDEEQVGTKSFLLASMLERFFGLYSAINSFSELRVTTPQRKGLLKEWAPRSGEQMIL